MVSSPRVQRMSLSAIGTPCSPRAAVPVEAVGLGQRQRRRASRRKACSSPSQPLDPRRGRRRPARGRRPRPRRAARRSARRSARACRSFAPRQSAAPGTRRPARRARWSAPRRAATTAAARRGGSRSPIERVGRRRHAGQVELATAPPRGRGSLDSCSAVRVDLVVGQRQPRERGRRAGRRHREIAMAAERSRRGRGPDHDAASGRAASGQSGVRTTWTPVAGLPLVALRDLELDPLALGQAAVALAPRSRVSGRTRPHRRPAAMKP